MNWVKMINRRTGFIRSEGDFPFFSFGVPVDFVGSSGFYFKNDISGFSIVKTKEYFVLITEFVFPELVRLKREFFPSLVIGADLKPGIPFR